MLVNRSENVIKFTFKKQTSGGKSENKGVENVVLAIEDQHKSKSMGRRRHRISADGWTENKNWYQQSGMCRLVKISTVIYFFLLFCTLPKHHLSLSEPLVPKEDYFFPFSF